MAALPASAVARVVRSSARLALWASVVATLGAALALERFARPLPTGHEEAIASDQARWAGIDFAALPEVQLLQQYVRIDSSHPDPDELAAAEFLAARLREMGLEPHVERLGERSANVWAWVEGRRPEALVLHGHLDVEPTMDRGLWRHEPFGAEIDGPWIYGRGIYDMKSLAVAQLAAVADLAAAARAGRPPEMSVLFLQTSSEESGSDLGTRRILLEHPELVRRMAAVLTEGGVVEAIGPTDVKYWGIEFAQKRYASFDLCSPERERLEEIRRELMASPQGHPRHPLPEPIRRFLAAWGPTRGAEFFRRRLSNAEALALDAPRFAQLTPFMRSLYRDEVYPFQVRPDPGGGFTMKVFLHLFPGSELDAVARRLVPEELVWGVARTPPELLGSDRASPTDHPVYRALERVTRAR
jgi:hypothetical protein